MGIVIMIAILIAIFTTIMACLRKPSISPNHQLSTHEQSMSTQEANTLGSTVQAVFPDQINTEKNLAYETILNY